MKFHAEDMVSIVGTGLVGVCVDVEPVFDQYRRIHLFYKVHTIQKGMLRVPENKLEMFEEDE